ncbi:MAG: DUF2007 domain-containing protein [Planctomycetes bacterium]|nr:DUF2007 domain-containing protein [Planctomycetota bacterium]
MADDTDDPVRLTTAANEAMAAMIVAALDQRGIQASAAGGLTSGFRAEAPGGVNVLVRRSELERALAVLEEIKQA